MDNLQKLLAQKEEMLKKKEFKKLRHLEEIYHQKTSGEYIGDLVYGANDGLVTTFAVVAGAIGAALSSNIILILGFANLVADGLSMGIGNYLSIKSETEYQKGQRKKEEWEIENLRPIEEAEIKHIYQKKGFEGEDLVRAVKIVTGNKKIWVDDMMKEELGIIEEKLGNPLKHGLATFIAFSLAGAIPLLPFVLHFPSNLAINTSIFLTAVTLFMIGALRTLITPKKWYLAGVEILLVGGLAALAAFVTGDIIERV